MADRGPCVSTTMRIELEQFLAATMALGTVGAIGVAVYAARGGAIVPSAPEDLVLDVAEDEPDAVDWDRPAIPEEKRAPVEPPIVPDPEPEPGASADADSIPGPTHEGMW